MKKGPLNMISMIQWNAFVNAFNALGDETRGMIPTAASLLFYTAIDYLKDGSRGYQPIRAGRPLCSRYSRDGDIIDIIRDYSKCAEFWDVEMNLTRVRITQAGIDYVNKHIDVFRILLDKQQCITRTSSQFVAHGLDAVVIDAPTPNNATGGEEEGERK